MPRSRADHRAGRLWEWRLDGIRGDSLDPNLASDRSEAKIFWRESLLFTGRRGQTLVYRVTGEKKLTVDTTKSSLTEGRARRGRPAGSAAGTSHSRCAFCGQVDGRSLRQRPAGGDAPRVSLSDSDSLGVALFF